MALFLVTDDSAFQRKIISDYLIEAGHRTIEAVDGSDCIEKAKTQKPDCILLDLTMPKIKGQDVLKELSNLKITIPVVVITADIQESSREQCLALGARAYLNKPFKKNELVNVLGKIFN